MQPAANVCSRVAWRRVLRDRDEQQGEGDGGAEEIWGGAPQMREVLAVLLCVLLVLRAWRCLLEGGDGGGGGHAGGHANRDHLVRQGCRPTIACAKSDNRAEYPRLLCALHQERDKARVGLRISLSTLSGGRRPVADRPHSADDRCKLWSMF